MEKKYKTTVYEWIKKYCDNRVLPSIISRLDIEIKEQRREAQKELLLEMFDKGAWKSTEEYLEYINNKLKEIDKQ